MSAACPLLGTVGVLLFDCVQDTESRRLGLSADVTEKTGKRHSVAFWATALSMHDTECQPSMTVAKHQP